MKKREIILTTIALILLLTNIATVLLHFYKISELRQLSSFRVIAKEEPTFKACLDRVGIENKIEDGHIKVREVDTRSAINSCS